jgi:hypothetical protein
MFQCQNLRYLENSTISVQRITARPISYAKFLELAIVNENLKSQNVSMAYIGELHFCFQKQEFIMAQTRLHSPRCGNLHDTLFIWSKYLKFHVLCHDT